MIQYNVTVNIDPSVHEEWLQWMKEKHIPEVMSTGCFIENKICRLLGHDDQGITYSFQYLCNDMPTYEKYQREFAPALQKDHASRYEGKFVAFRTLLQVVHNQSERA